jgi:3'-phosphoadenosine 5'-phosphosulfate sulfotransferase (PAPS reductase)/FAD synthetase
MYSDSLSSFFLMSSFLLSTFHCSLSTFHYPLSTVQFFSCLDSTSYFFFSFGIAGLWEMKRTWRWFDIHMEVEILFLKIHILFHNTLYWIDNSTDIDKLKLVIMKKKLEKSTSYLNIQIANIQHM